MTSKVVPNFSYNRIDNPQRPHSGQSFYRRDGNRRTGRQHALLQARSPSGRSSGRCRRAATRWAFRVQGSWISGYAGDVAPPFDRFYMGGDQDLRGFDIRTVSPVVFFPTAVTIPLQNPDGTHGAAGSDESAARDVERHHSRESDHLPRRRHQLRGQPRVSRADRRTGDAGAICRYRNGLHYQHLAAAHREYQQVLTLNTTSYGCPYLNLDYSAAPERSRIPVSPVPESAVRDQLSAAHVHRSGVAGHLADCECAVPHLLRL